MSLRVSHVTRVWYDTRARWLAHIEKDAQILAAFRWASHIRKCNHPKLIYDKLTARMVNAMCKACHTCESICGPCHMYELMCGSFTRVWHDPHLKWACLAANTAFQLGARWLTLNTQNLVSIFSKMCEIWSLRRASTTHTYTHTHAHARAPQLFTHIEATRQVSAVLSKPWCRWLLCESQQLDSSCIETRKVEATELRNEAPTEAENKSGSWRKWGH